MAAFNLEFQDFMKTLGDSTRLEIIELLKTGEKKAIEIQETLQKSQSTISQHLTRLIKNNIIKCRLEDEEVIQIVTDSKNHGKKEVTRKVKMKYYYVEHNEIFNIIANLKSFVSKLQTKKLDEISQSDVLDTLL